MVRLVPVRAVNSTSEDYVANLGSPGNKIPNRFRSKHYDRSVFGGDECVKNLQSSCACAQCHPNPLVVISTGQRICDKYNITLRNVKEFVDGGLLEAQEEEAFMIYAQKTAAGNYQVGVLAALDVEDCKKNIIKKHELCVPRADEMKSYRVKHFQSLYVDPIMVMHRHNEAVDLVLQSVMNTQKPVSLGLDESDDDDHLLWTVRETEHILALQNAFSSVDAVYIADGHHRTSAACSRYDNESHSKPPSSRYLTALLFSATQLSVLSYHRCLRSLPCGEDAFLSALQRTFHLSPCDSMGEASAASERGDLVMCLPGCRWLALSLLAPPSPDCPLATIQAQMLVDHIFDPICQLRYPDGEKEVHYVDGREGFEGIERCIQSGEAVVGFALRRVSPSEVMAVADANKLLPPKATFFDPKPMPGLLLRLQR
eukprot:gene2001-2184_t